MLYTLIIIPIHGIPYVWTLFHNSMSFNPSVKNCWKIVADHLLTVLDAIKTFIYMFYVNRCWDLCILGYDSKTLITLLKVSTKKTIVPVFSILLYVLPVCYLSLKQFQVAHWHTPLTWWSFHKYRNSCEARMATTKVQKLYTHIHLN